MLTSISHKSGSVVKSFTEYSYDQRNYPSQKRMPSGIIDYTYDLNGSLLSASKVGGSTESFGYDNLGNRVLDATGAMVYDPSAQRITEDWQYLYGYDGNGNIVQKMPKDNSKNAFVYSYSSKNQLIQVKTLQTPLGSMIKQVDYVYDVFGRLIQKTAWDSSAATDPKKTFVRKYIYDGSSVLFEYDSNNNLLSKYTHGALSADDVLAVSVTSAGVTAGVATSSGSAYYLKDALGTVTDIINGSGNIVQSYEYSAFGVIQKISDSVGADITATPVVKTFYSYTGREWDSDTGLYNFRARFYDPNLGRFLQKDPDPGRITTPITTINSYIYCGNNPNIHTDPSGRGWVRAGAAILLGVIAVVIIVASGGTWSGAAIAVLSVAGGAAASSIAMAAFQKGNFWKNAENNFYPTFGIGIGLLLAGAIWSDIVTPGSWQGIEANGAGGNGLQGWIVTKSSLPFGEGVTLGTAQWSGQADILAHEFGHTIQFLALSVAAGYDNSAAGTWGAYLLLGLSGVGSSDTNPKAAESMADFFGGKLGYGF